MKSPVQFFAAIAIFLATATVAAQVFKWIDKDGKVNFSDTPPPAEAVKGEAKKLTVLPAANTPAPAPAKVKIAVDQAKEAEKKKTELADKAKKDEAAEQNAKQNEERCKDAKRYLSTLDSGTPIRQSNDAGERVFMNDEQRASETARAKIAVTESCKN
jgi:type IV secretory pathway VirJ component